MSSSSYGMDGMIEKTTARDNADGRVFYRIGRALRVIRAKLQEMIRNKSVRGIRSTSKYITTHLAAASCFSGSRPNWKAATLIVDAFGFPPCLGYRSAVLLSRRRER